MKNFIILKNHQLTQNSNKMHKMLINQQIFKSMRCDRFYIMMIECIYGLIELFQILYFEELFVLLASDRYLFEYFIVSHIDECRDF